MSCYNIFLRLCEVTGDGRISRSYDGQTAAGTLLTAALGPTTAGPKGEVVMKMPTPAWINYHSIHLIC